MSSTSTPGSDTRGSAKKSSSQLAIPTPRWPTIIPLDKRVLRHIVRVPPEDDPLGAVYLANQDSSPLLRLPAELRLLIYEHLFERGQQIQIFYAPPPSNNDSRGPKLQRLQHRVIRPHADLRWSSNDPCLGENRLTLISGVCRQLYCETSTLPMQWNRWTANHKDLTRFVLLEQRMSLRQRHALKELYCWNQPLSRALKAKFQMMREEGEKAYKALPWDDPKRKKASHNAPNWQLVGEGSEWVPRNIVLIII